MALRLGSMVYNYVPSLKLHLIPSPSPFPLLHRGTRVDFSELLACGEKSLHCMYSLEFTSAMRRNRPCQFSLPNQWEHQSQYQAKALTQPAH
ncbi:UNVERIFIED_CONTAM: hypothetical protein FKN15_003394 [Acipenser sinensis]